MRETGYYKVRIEKGWTVGYYHKPYNNWSVLGWAEGNWEDKDLQEIGEKLTFPGPEF